MQDDLPARREARCREMRVGISREEHRLEEQQARRPDPGPAPEPRKNELADKRLHLEQQERAGEDREGEGKHGCGKDGATGAWVAGR